MLQLTNTTPFAAERAILLDMEGRENWVVVVKGTFDIKNGEAVMAEEQVPVTLADEYNCEPGISSQKSESDLAFFKPATDILVNGHAYAPRGKAAKSLDVSIKIGSAVSKMVRVFGDRIWHKGLTGMSLSSPTPFDKIPLVYERAFGGVDKSSEDPKKHGAEERNPVGAGFAMNKKFLADKRAPNLEDHKHLIKEWDDRPEPQGFGPISKHWLPRRNYAGTYDQKWQTERLPLWPLDFNPQFFQCAHPSLIAKPYLHGGEAVELLNLTGNGKLAFQLPRIALAFTTRLSGKNVEHRAKLDTVIFEPDVPRVMLVWRTSIPCHRKKFELEWTRIYQKEVLS